MTRSIRWMGTVAALGAFLALPACDRDHDDHDGDEMEILHVRDRSQGGQPVVATWTRTGGWTGAIPDLPLADGVRHSLGFIAIAADGDTITLEQGGEYWMQYWLATGAPTGIIELPRDNIFHGDHVHIYGQSLGTTQIQFELWHVDHIENATTGIDITVVEPDP